LHSYDQLAARGRDDIGRHAIDAIFGRDCLSFGGTSRIDFYRYIVGRQLSAKTGLA